MNKFDEIKLLIKITQFNCTLNDANTINALHDIQKRYNSNEKDHGDLKPAVATVAKMSIDVNTTPLLFFSRLVTRLVHFVRIPIFLPHNASDGKKTGETSTR